MTDRRKILIVDDDRIILDSLCAFLRNEGYDVTGAANYPEAQAALSTDHFQLLITDVSMPQADGMELLRLVRKQYSEMVVLIITGYGSISGAVEAMKLGAFDYLTKPIVDEDIRLSVARALQQQQLLHDNIALRGKLEKRSGMDNVIGQDYKMLKIFDLVEAVAPTKTTVLISGESGTGKSMIARAVHHHSERAGGPFVEVSCGALPETLLESELFGHVKGSFTGAIADKEGRFLTADSGTIFLDEIDAAPPLLQVKLLRVLQERCFEPVGSNVTHTVDVRVVLASNKILLDEVGKGTFRQDLYYRINVVNLELPPLRDRVGDIAMLGEQFLERFASANYKSVSGFSGEAMMAMQRYGWPGNVRELENAMERAAVLCRGRQVEVDDLPPNIANDKQVVEEQKLPTSAASGSSLKAALQNPERQIIIQTLEQNSWNRQATAAALGINRTTLYKKMKRYGLDSPEGEATSSS